MRYLNIDPLFATQYNRDWNFHHITEGGIKRKEKGGVGVGIYDAHVNFPRLLLAVDPCSLPEASTWRTAQALRLRYSSAVFYMSILPIKWNRFRSDVGGLNSNSQRRPKRERERRSPPRTKQLNIVGQYIIGAWEKTNEHSASVSIGSG